MSRRECQLLALGRVAGQRVREALGRVAAAREELGQQRARLEELKGYLHDYTAGSGDRPASPELLSNRSAFIARLETAVDIQTRVVAEAHERVQHAQADWQGQRRDANGVETLLSREQAARLAAAARHEQHQLDDAAQQRFVRAGGQTVFGA